MKSAWLAAAAAIAFAALPAAAQGFGPGHGRGDGPGRGRGGPGGPGGPPPIHQMAKELGLSAEQQAQVKAITGTYMDGVLGDAMDSMREARETLGRVIHDATATDDAVTVAAAAVATVESRIAVLRHHMVVEIAGVLTAEQKAKLDALAEEHRGRAGPQHRRRF